MKAYVKLTLIILFSYMITFLGLWTLKSQSNYESTYLGDQMQLTITRTDGSTESYVGNEFPILNRGDRLTARIPIPDSIDYDNPVLCFGCYNCELTLSTQWQPLYTYGQELAASGRHIGSVYASVPFSREEIGKTLILQALANEDRATGELLDVTCLPGTEAKYWLFMDHFPQAIFMITLLTGSFMMTIVLILSDGRKKFVRLALWLLSFMNLVTTYRLASSGILYSLIGQEMLCSRAEYVCFFAMPIPLYAFFAEFYQAPKARRFAQILLVVQSILFVTTTVLNYTTRDYHYCRFLQLQNVMTFLAIGCALILSRRNVIFDGNSESSLCMRRGLIHFFLCVICHTVQYYLKKYTFIRSEFLNFDFLFLGIVLTSASFIMSIFLKVTRAYAEKSQKNYFEQLAYTDALTGLGSRAKYYEHITQMRLQNIQEYTLYFMDLNNLKEVNDLHGHEYGDLYIKAAAKAILQTFRDSDEEFRIGGDEFLVIYNRLTQPALSEMQQALDDNFQQICTDQELPFRGSIACGRAESTLVSPMDIEDTLKHADQKMYEHKRQLKEKYGESCRSTTSLP